MARALLIVPAATYRAEAFIAAARRQGIAVAIACDIEQTLAATMGDRALHLRLDHPDAAASAIVAHARKTPLDAVVALDEQGVRVAALAARELGLNHNSAEAVARATDKYAMRQAFALADVEQPKFRMVTADQDVAAVAASAGFPCVIKATSLSGSRGVVRVASDDEAAAAAKLIRKIISVEGAGANAGLLVEQYVPGVEVAVEGVLHRGVLKILAVFDKPDPLDGPYFEETIYVTPSRLDPKRLAQIRLRTHEAVAALGLTEGPIHAELRLDGDRAWIIEVAARSIGGLCSRALGFGDGVTLEQLILRQALGLPIGHIERESAASGVMMLPIPKTGVLQGVSGLDSARAVDGIRGLEVSIPIGRRVLALPEGDRYLGFMFAKGETPQRVEAALRTAHSLLDVQIAAD